MDECIVAPKVSVLDDPARAVVDEIAAVLAARPTAVLGLATGGTMIPVYDEIAARVAAGRLSLARATSFNLDEYAGLEPGHDQSYRHFMTEMLLSRSDMDPARMHLPDGNARDLDAEAARYEAQIAVEGPVDLQLLGIGANGHIGFNEPGSPAHSRTRVVELAARTRADNARYFRAGEAPPRHAITMGIATILAARRIVLLATGPGKADAVVAMLSGTAGGDCPAAHLRRHGRVHVVLDAAAAARLDR